MVKYSKWLPNEAGKENFMKKFISVFLAVTILVFAFSGCTGQKEKQLFGTVAIVGPDGEMILDTELYVNAENATAADAVKEACSQVRLSYTYENGMFDNFGGIASGDEDGWLFYNEGELAQVGAGQCEISNAFEIEFRYVNYNESFSLN